LSDATLQAVQACVSLSPSAGTAFGHVSGTAVNKRAELYLHARAIARAAGPLGAQAEMERLIQLLA
jgi:hypothetical protein